MLYVIIHVMVRFLWFTLYNLLNNKVVGLQKNKPHSFKHN